MEQDLCQDAMLHWSKSQATREPWVCRLYWDNVTCLKRLHIENRKVFLVFSYSFYEFLYFHHYGEVNQRLAVKITVAWGLVVNLRSITSWEWFCREA